MENRNEHMECTFDAYCKKLLKNESINIHLEYERQNQREVSLSGLTGEEMKHLQYIDPYAPERCAFSVMGLDVEIVDADLVQALSALSADSRTVVLLAYLLDLSDREIAEKLNWSRSAVQRRRVSPLAQLRKLLEDFEYG